MTNEQIVAITAPMAFNGVIIGLMVLWMRAKFEAIDKRFDSIDKRFDSEGKSVGSRFDGINQRFDDMRDLWRAELRRVEEILDARLKHLEER
jgi:hypothetical protein